MTIAVTILFCLVAINFALTCVAIRVAAIAIKHTQSLMTAIGLMQAATERLQVMGERVKSIVEAMQN